MNENEKSQSGLIIAIITIAVLVIGVIGATYAYFQATVANNAIVNVVIKSNTMDSLSFTSGANLSFTLTQANMAKGTSDITLTSTATTPKAKLIGRNDAASDYCYDILVDITTNALYGEGQGSDMRVACSQTSGNSNNTCGSVTMGTKAPGSSATVCSQQKLHTAAGGTQENVYSCTVQFINRSSVDQTYLANKTVFDGKIRFQRVTCS